jgi:hypothetical protein
MHTFPRIYIVACMSWRTLLLYLKPRKHTEEIRGTTPVDKSKLQSCTICAALLRPVHRRSAVQESDETPP